MAQHFLLKEGNITCIRRVRKTDNNRISRICGATICNRPEELEEKDVGTDCAKFEVKKLGDHARERISAASMFANKFFPKESLGAVSRMCETHDGIVAIEAIMEATKDASLSGTGVPVVNVDENKLREMMQDPRYWDPKSRDPGFVSQVDNGFKRLYRG